MGYPRAPQQNEAFSLLGGFRGKIFEVFDKNTPDKNGKPMGFTHCTVLLDFGMPPQFRVPILRDKLNMTEGEDIPPEKGDWVMLVFLHGNIDLPIIVGYLPPPQNEGVNTVETEKVATEPQLHRHWKGSDWRSDKDHNWIEGFPKDHRRRVKEEIHDAGDGKRYTKTKDDAYAEFNSGNLTKVKKDDGLQADNIVRLAKTAIRFFAPRIEMGGANQQSSGQQNEATVDQSNNKITPQADTPGTTYPFSGTPAADSPVIGPGTVDQKTLQAAQAKIGDEYVWGGSGENDQFDCSGLASVSGREGGAFPAGYRNTAAGLYTDMAQSVPAGSEQPGDFVFFRNPSGSISHVGIVQDPAAMTMVHAGNPGTGVTTGYYNRYRTLTIAGFRRPSGGLL
ncbi:MAG: C40 family peptidase [Candidatus Wallbacteria bacterium]|nr:C40 family peptidase [Candidatus Wallbacteria bacterium]